MLRWIVVLSLIALPLAAQSSSNNNDRTAVEQIVRDYVGLYTAKDLDRWKALFHPELRVAHPSEEGTIVVRDLARFFDSQKRGFAEDPSMHEVVENVKIDMARRMARVSADYIFTSDGRSSRGKLGLHLVRGTDGWKIVGIVFSYDDESDCGASCTQKSPTSSSATACPADRPVDDMIAEIRKQQGKMASRNKNPLPDISCIWGWCRQTRSRTPPTIPEPAPQSGAPDTGSASSSRVAPDACSEAMEKSLGSAHDVEVGDFNFNEKNYKGALMRYDGALKNKPEDIAIHVRLGRVLEKLNDTSKALMHYQAAERLSGQERWREEARAAVLRLQPTAEKNN